MSPQRRGIVAKRVVHPFPNLVSRDRSVTNGGTEETCGVKVKWREGLDRRTDRIMEPKYAALVQVVWYTDRHHHVVHQKYWELRSVDSLCGQQLEQNREYGVDVEGDGFRSNDQGNDWSVYCGGSKWSRGKWILSHHYPGVSVAVAAGDGRVIECSERAIRARVRRTT